MAKHSVTCDYCHGPAEPVTGSALYPHRKDLYHKHFWRCIGCAAHVGCHENGWKPLGRIANAELRRAKNRAHAAFDPIWKSRRMRRADAYKWLADKLGIAPQNCHIGMMDVDGCDAVVAVMRAHRDAP